MYHCPIMATEGKSAIIDATAAADWTERLALFGSAACMAHCLALPLLLAAIPAFASVLALPESFHRWVLAVAVPAAAFALLQGRARHGACWPLLLGAIGVAALGLGAFALDEGAAETVATVLGSLMLGGAHLANWRLRHAG